ncbi:MAG: uroporphyrinogen-III C-methyltransferase [Halofilum sp. (in: g-proteobacteria)]|nr:uroporphyrinogen-III C-methyltransferase [Halofilum sp. (in: g-proteobacteria)]
MNESRPEDSEERPEDTAPPAGGQDPSETAEADASVDTDATEHAAESGDGEASRSGSQGPPAGAAPRRRGGWITFIVFLIALGAAGAAGYLGWRLDQLEQRVARIPDQRAAALESYLRPDALQPLQARIESLEARRKALSDRLGDRVEQLAQSIETVRAVAERHQIGWRLAEIRYLLAIAVRRLTIAYDLDGAEAALSAADDAVATLQDVRLIPLRKAIIADLGAVREVQPADIEGIALRLQSLLNQVDDLPRAPIDPAAAEGGDARPDGWLQQLRDKLAGFVVVQRRPGGPAPVVPKHGPGLGPGDALTLALEDARRAALARDEENYERALRRAAGTLADHFDAEAGSTIRFREGLADLRGRTVETRVPDLTDTLELARRLAAEVEQARREAEVEPAADEAATGETAAGD